MTTTPGNVVPFQPRSGPRRAPKRQRRKVNRELFATLNLKPVWWQRRTAKLLSRAVQIVFSNFRPIELRINHGDFFIIIPLGLRQEFDDVERKRLECLRLLNALA